MNNTLCLGLFLFVVAAQHLDWVYSSEVTAIVGARRLLQRALALLPGVWHLAFLFPVSTALLIRCWPWHGHASIAQVQHITLDADCVHTSLSARAHHLRQICEASAQA